LCASIAPPAPVGSNDSMSDPVRSKTEPLTQKHGSSDQCWYCCEAAAAAPQPASVRWPHAVLAVAGAFQVYTSACAGLVRAQLHRQVHLLSAAAVVVGWWRQPHSFNRVVQEESNRAHVEQPRRTQRAEMQSGCWKGSDRAGELAMKSNEVWRSSISWQGIGGRPGVAS